MAGLIAGESASLRGAAPRARLLSLQVLNESASGRTSALIDALDAVWQWNQGGRTIRVHGVNLSLGYDFDPEWFACGQSPLCAEVNRLVASGVAVVAAAGNSGYGAIQTLEGFRRAPLPLTINDPGNAELAITVGATHRDQPHTYGVSWFSSKGPTGDGRAKPDLVAPGERILSACAKTLQAVEDSGTSVAAALTSGALAAFLSARPEFIGQPRELKRIILDACQDLRRDPAFQGRGLLDLMKALQSV
jgi:subtilisin family serine protease